MQIWNFEEKQKQNKTKKKNKKKKKTRTKQKNKKNGVNCLAKIIHRFRALKTFFFADNEELMMNPNCRQLIFMNYLREKCQYDKGGQFSKPFQTNFQEIILGILFIIERASIYRKKELNVAISASYFILFVCAQKL